jgi:amino acid adenylation domain-containing protein
MMRRGIACEPHKPRAARTGSGILAEAALSARFRDVADRFPESVAVEFGDKRMTYAELAAAVSRVATHLRLTWAIGPGDRVALCVEPSIESVVCILAIVSCGAAYVPLDVAGPARRNRLIIEDCAPNLLIGDIGDIGDTNDMGDVGLGVPVLPADAVRGIRRQSAMPGPLDVQAGIDDICYVIYTSGTTGTPKGVPISHRNVSALFTATAGLFDFREDDVWLLYHSIAFDFSVWELWGPLLHGACLVVVDRWTKLSPERCAAMVVDRAVTVLNQTPTAFAMLSAAILDSGVEPGRLGLRYVVFGGERLATPGLRPWADRFGLDAPELINMYGLTEATVHTTFHRVTPMDLTSTRSPIGHPLPGFVARVIDDRGQPGSRGELMVAGPQVAAGYLNRPELTVQRFGPDPLGLVPTTFYRTGDLVELSAGVLVYAGRSDQQVKIRGHRIELGEVATAVMAVPGVSETCVVLLDSGEPLLACAYTTRDGSSLTQRELRRELRDRIPQYMLPSQFRLFGRLPLTINGKVDPAAVRKEMETKR